MRTSTTKYPKQCRNEVDIYGKSVPKLDHKTMLENRNQKMRKSSKNNFETARGKWLSYPSTHFLNYKITQLINYSMTQSLNHWSIPLLSYSIFNYSMTQLNKCPTTQWVNYSIASTLILNDSNTSALSPSAHINTTAYDYMMTCSRFFEHTPFNSLQASPHGACKVSRAAHSTKPFAAHWKSANSSATHETNTKRCKQLTA